MKFSAVTELLVLCTGMQVHGTGLRNSMLFGC